MKKKQRFSLALVFLLFTCILGCENRESMLFEGNTCELPCWRGIELGMSSDEVKEILSTMSGLKPFSISLGESKTRALNNWISVTFESGTFRNATFYFAGDQLKVMAFREPVRDNRELWYWIEELGQPNQISLYGGILTRFAMWHSYYYLNSPICLYGKPVSKKEVFTIDSDTLIEAVIIADLTYDKGLANIDCYSDFFQNQMQQWVGYQEYKICPNQEYLCD